jgi:hypothetical protein
MPCGVEEEEDEGALPLVLVLLVEVVAVEVLRVLPLVLVAIGAESACLVADDDALEGPKRRCKSP